MINTRLEKYALFSKDFQGLPDGWHNLRACNFLVGENSTGKSSFLQLIELMDTQQHMLFFEILGVVDGIEEPADVRSRISGSPETTIGYLIKQAENEDGISNIHGRLVTYEVQNEELQIKKITVVENNKCLRLKKSGNKISFRFDMYNYNTENSHAENGALIEQLHSGRENGRTTRFYNHHYLKNQGQTHVWDWVEALNVATIDEQGANFRGFYGMSPLGCLAYGPMRAKTRRLHHGAKTNFSKTGEHTPYLLRDVFENSPKLRDAVNDFGKASGLYDEFSISTIKTKVKDKPFVLQIRKADKHYYVDELGFGVGQILPIVADIAVYPVGTSFLVQQPELHLHPKAQAALGDVFFEASERGSCLVIETHSDFTIDRFRMLQKKNTGEKRAQIIYFEKDAEGKNVAHEIEIMPNGTMGETPETYRDFFLKESFDKFEAL